MRDRYLRVVALERFLVVERYRGSHQVVSSRPRPLPGAGPDRAGSPAKAASRTAANPRA